MIALAVKMPKLGRLANLTDEQIKAVQEQAAIGVRNAVRANFDTLGGESFWGEASARTRVEELDGGHAVTIRQRGVALQRYGGKVTPGKSISTFTGEPTKTLAVPMMDGIKESPNAYGVLACVPVKGGGILRGLLYPGEVGVARFKYKDKPAGRKIVRPVPGSSPYFCLVTETVHVPHENVLPDDSTLENEATRYAANKVRKIMNAE